MRNLMCFGLLASLAVPAAGQQGAEWQQSPMVMLPGALETGEGEFEEGQTVFRLPFHWLISVRLGETITIPTDDGDVVFEEGSQLPGLIAGEGRDMANERTGFCTRSRIGVRGGASGGGAWGGLLGGMVGVRLAESLMDAQTCLEDTDADGMFDRAFAVGRGDNDMIDLGEITPVPFTVDAFDPVDGGEDYLDVVLRQTRDDYAEFELKMYVNGDRIQFDTMRASPFTVTDVERVMLVSEGDEEVTLRDMLDNPRTRSILGVAIDVISTDRRADSARIGWKPGVEEDFPLIVPGRITVAYY